MGEFLHQLASGLALGGIYAIMALALVMIYQATQLVNFAQGEMAMFSTYFAWWMTQNGWPYWAAFPVTLVASFIAGALIERAVVRPFAKAPVLASVHRIHRPVLHLLRARRVVLRLFGAEFRQPVSRAAADRRRLHVVPRAWRDRREPRRAGLVYAFFRFTPLGLAMRAAAQNPVSARLVGVNVG